MELSRREVRLLLLHEFRLGGNATQAAANICRTMGENVVSERVAQIWFRRFGDGNFCLDDLPHTGRPTHVDTAALKTLVDNNPRLSLRDLGKKLTCSRTTVGTHLRKLGKTWRYGIQTPHVLSPCQLQNRVDVCTKLVRFRRTFKWLDNLITGDEKWVLYANPVRKRQWLGPGQPGVESPLPELHPRKSLLCVWWGIRGVVHWELLPYGHTITAAVYCQQLSRVAEKLAGKQGPVYFLHDNASSHSAKLTKKKLLELKWKVVPHPAYSPDIAPTDYHLFRSLAHHLGEKEFKSDEDIKSSLETFFDEKTVEFYERGIMLLPERWQQIIESGGAYVNESLLTH
jgi:histone-lysine N-methyltransferase SETMAR